MKKTAFIFLTGLAIALMQFSKSTDPAPVTNNNTTPTAVCNYSVWSGVNSGACPSNAYPVSNSGFCPINQLYYCESTGKYYTTCEQADKDCVSSKTEVIKANSTTNNNNNNSNSTTATITFWTKPSANLGNVIPNRNKT